MASENTERLRRELHDLVSRIRAERLLRDRMRRGVENPLEGFEVRLASDEEGDGSARGRGG